MTSYPNELDRYLGQLYADCLIQCQQRIHLLQKTENNRKIHWSAIFAIVCENIVRSYYLIVDTQDEKQMLVENKKLKESLLPIAWKIVLLVMKDLPDKNDISLNELSDSSGIKLLEMMLNKELNNQWISSHSSSNQLQVDSPYSLLYELQKCRSVPIQFKYTAQSCVLSYHVLSICIQQKWGLKNWMAITECAWEQFVKLLNEGRIVLGVQKNAINTDEVNHEDISTKQQHDIIQMILIESIECVLDTLRQFQEPYNQTQSDVILPGIKKFVEFMLSCDEQTKMIQQKQIVNNRHLFHSQCSCILQ